jgi:hypothetical protein
MTGGSRSFSSAPPALAFVTTDNIWAIKGRAGKNGRGYHFFVKVLAKGPKSVQEAIDLGARIGLSPRYGRDDPNDPQGRGR